jgi:predicted NUDIX family NTP pyrophosphohydrolase
MAKQSAGILLYRRRGGEPEVFLVHPGGPFLQKKTWAPGLFQRASLIRMKTR